MISLRVSQAFIQKSLPQCRRTATASFSYKRGQMTMWGEETSKSSINKVPKSDAFSSRTQPRIVSDEDGRRVRQQSQGSKSSREVDDWGGIPNDKRSINDSWDDWGGNRRKIDRRPERSGRGGSGRGTGSRGRGRGGTVTGRARDSKDTRSKWSNDSQAEKSAAEIKINMRALEMAGFVHLYGLAPIVNALTANRRDMKDPASEIDIDLLQGEDLEHEQRQRERKPEAQFSPYLFVQEGQQKKGDKASMADEVEKLAREKGVPIAYVDKGVLNTLSGARPHQGYVLRCGSIEFENLPRMPRYENDDEFQDVPQLWLVLDEVVDPQNFGALLRSAYFLGGSSSDNGASIGILVCEKNSAPPSAVVSAASAGALEVSQIYSTSNLPKLLNGAREDGWRILGAAASVPSGMRNEDNSPVECITLSDVEKGVPTLLVLGSEGSGLRTLVARACTGFVKIPGSDAARIKGGNAGVDSLNVSVTGGIMLWHLLSK